MSAPETAGHRRFSSKRVTSENDFGNNIYLCPDNARAKAPALTPFWSHLINRKDLKTWFKCSIAAYVATVFIFITPILHSYGKATFFGAIMIFIFPPTGNVFVAIMHAVLTVLGMLTAWAWGVITMVAAVAAQKYRHVPGDKGGYGNQDFQPSLDNETSFFANGASGPGKQEPIDANKTATYFCMLGAFLYLICRIRLAYPKFFFFQIFGMLITDIFFTMGPLFEFRPEIAKLLLIPATSAIAISVVCNVLFFPEFTSEGVLSDCANVLSPIEHFLDAILLGFEHHPVHFNLDELRQTENAIVGAYKRMEGNLGFLKWDFAVGKWNEEDVFSLKEPIGDILTMFLGLLQLRILTTEEEKRISRLKQRQDILESGSTRGNGADGSGHGAFQDYRGIDLLNLYSFEENSQRVKEGMNELAASTKDIILAAGEASVALVDAIRQANATKWFFRSSWYEGTSIVEKHREILENLRTERTRFADLNTEYLLESHKHLFDKDGHLLNADDPIYTPVPGFLLALVFEERILSLADSLEQTLALVVEIEERRKVAKIWWPPFIRDAWRRIRGVASDVSEFSLSQGYKKLVNKTQRLGMDATKNNPSEQNGANHGGSTTKPTSASEELNGLSLLHGNRRSRIERAVLATSDWFTGHEGLYALRTLIVTVVLALPAVIVNRGSFYYRQDAVWALIMAQTCLFPLTADLVFSYVSRLLGAFLGGVTGLALWYIGTGSSPGDPIRISVVMAFVVPSMMYCRLFCSLKAIQFVVLTIASIYLVVGYSWADDKLDPPDNPGIGFEVWWRRTVTVTIGYTAAVVVHFVPRPPSATKDISATLAGTTKSFKNLYSLLLTSWADPPSDLPTVIETQYLTNAAVLGALPPRIAMLNWEFTASKLDSATLQRLCSLARRINQNLAQLFTYAVTLPPGLKARFARLTGLTDERLVADVMAVVSLVEQALETERPLPSVLPTPLLSRMPAFRGERGGGEAPIAFEEMKSEAFRRYCVAMNAFTGFLNPVDEMVRVLKGAIGEAHDVPAWHDRRAREDAVGRTEVEV